MKHEFHVVVERDALSYYVARVPGLHGCHTQARSLDKLLERIEEAIALCLKSEDTHSADSPGGRSTLCLRRDRSGSRADASKF